MVFSVLCACFVSCIFGFRVHPRVQMEESVLEEAAVLGRLSHSSIVRLLSFQTLPNYHYMVLEVRKTTEL